MTLDQILAAITSIITAAIGWVGDAINVIEDNPILLFAVLIPFVGVGISLLRRLFKSKA